MFLKALDGRIIQIQTSVLVLVVVVLTGSVACIFKKQKKITSRGP